MNKHKNLEEDSIINPNFATSTYYGEPALTEDELISKLKSDYAIYLKFIKYGYIISREFSFITCSTFDEMRISELDYRYHGAKTPEQKEQAIKMCKVVEDYFNSINPKKHVKVAFCYRSDRECALYDANRNNLEKINEKLMKAFS